MNRRVILAGGSGFLGQLLGGYLQPRGWEPVVLARSPSHTFRVSVAVRAQFVLHSQHQKTLRFLRASLSLQTVTASCSLRPTKKANACCGCALSIH